MNKEYLLQILESCLLTFDGVTEKQMLELTPLDSECIKIGIFMCDYLKKLELHED